MASKIKLTRKYIFLQKLKGEPIYWRLISNVSGDPTYIKNERLLFTLGIWEHAVYPNTGRKAIQTNYPLHVYYKSPKNEFSDVEQIVIDDVLHSIRKLEIGDLIDNG